MEILLGGFYGGRDILKAILQLHGFSPNKKTRWATTPSKAEVKVCEEKRNWFCRLLRWNWYARIIKKPVFTVSLSSSGSNEWALARQKFDRIFIKGYYDEPFGDEDSLCFYREITPVEETTLIWPEELHQRFLLNLQMISQNPRPQTHKDFWFLE